MRLLASWDKSDLFLLLWIYIRCGFTLTSGWCNSKLSIYDYLEIFFLNFAYLEEVKLTALPLQLKHMRWLGREFSHFVNLYSEAGMIGINYLLEFNMV